FVEGLAARLIEGIAFTVVASLLASLAVAMFLIPALARWFMPETIPAERIDSGLEIRTRFARVALRLLERPVTVVLSGIVIAAVGCWQLLGLGTELLPSAAPRQFSVRIVGPPGQRVESTARVVEGVESLINQFGEGSVVAILSEVGRLPEDSRMVRTELTEEHTSRVTVRVSESGPTGRQFADQLAPILEQRESTDIDWEVGSSAVASALGTSGPAVVVEISGQALTDLRRYAEVVKTKLADLNELWNVRSSFEGGPPELRIELDRAMADGLGVDLATISRVLQASLDGRDVTMLSTGDEERPVTLRLGMTSRDDIGSVIFQTNSGRKVAISEVARFVEAEGAREIFRQDQRRTALVTAQIAEGSNHPNAVRAVNAALREVSLPAGLQLRLRGEEAERVRTFAELRLAAVLALVLVFMVLAGSFESLIHPLTVLAAVPLGLIGVAVALVPGGQPIGVMAMLGLIVLAGVAVNDAVLLIATARRLMTEGRSRIEALAEATGIRLRPIIMTTLTTVLVLLPLAFGAGEGAELRTPMAITIIGGIIASTLGSLFVLPSLYLLLDRLHPGHRSDSYVVDQAR
ncbi:MAG: efflux RND transporter permease subunit, partial [Pseudomonadales bacterium]|nr:efflux RND transporter permease subunit [Pseudomonadales bacterium]